MKYLAYLICLYILSSPVLIADIPIRVAEGKDSDPVIVYNNADDEYLVAWNVMIPFGDDDFVYGPVYAQRFNINGVAVGNAVEMYSMAHHPALAYNEVQNEYLVAYASAGNIYGQLLNADGSKKGDANLLVGNAGFPKVVYNELKNESLLIAQQETVPGEYRIIAVRIDKDAQMVSSPRTLLTSTLEDHTYSIAYASVSSYATPSGFYLFAAGPDQLMMLNDEGEKVLIDGSHYIDFDHGYPEGGFTDERHVDVAFGYGDGNIPGYTGSLPNSTITGPVFMVVWSDGDNEFPWPQRDWTDDYPGAWGGFLKIDPATSVPSYISNSSCPLIDLELVHSQGGLLPGWKPRVAYNKAAQKFFTVWREVPSNIPTNQTVYPHIRGSSEFQGEAYTGPDDIILSRTNGDENPSGPVIASSSSAPSALVIWQDERNLAANNMDLYGNLFQESAAGGLYLESPDGGEVWQAGTKHLIRWQSINYTGNVKIGYSYNGGESYTTIIASVPDNGSYEWTVPDTPSDHCMVRISNAAGGVPVDISDAFFRITAASGSISLIDPNGGEKWYSGANRMITWKNNNFNDPVKIEYSLDGGTSFQTIESAIANSGSYSWDVPDTPSSNCLVKISDATDGIPADTSDNIFDIILSSLSLTSPDGGEKWKVGSQHNISWTSQNIPNNDVMIEYSVDSGQSFIPIAYHTNNSPEESYLWTIPDNPSGKCFIKISLNIQGAYVYDICDAAFEIYSDVWNGDLLIETQQEVDDFHYVTVNGNLVIKEKSSGEIQNLNGLSSLTSVSKDFLIWDNDLITNLDSLINLNSVGKEFRISYNEKLESIKGLANLTSVETLAIKNPALTNLDGLSSTIDIRESLSIAGKSLTDIEALSGITGIDFLYISGTSLTDLHGLSSLKGVARVFSISGNPLLENLDGLEGITSIGDERTPGLIIRNNDALTNIDGLINLNDVEGNITIKGNKSLVNIDGLINNDYIDDGNLEIKDNPALVDVNGLSGLTGMNGSHISISNNDALTDINGLSGIEDLEAHLYIEDNDLLTNLSGLSNLTRLHGYLVVTDNDNLTEYCGLYSLIESSWVDSVIIENNLLNPSLDEILNNGPCANTESGIDIILGLSPKFSIKFNNVIEEGMTTLDINQEGPLLPEDFSSLAIPPLYYMVSTTAEFTDNLSVSIVYDDASISSNLESYLKLFMYNGAEWEEVTSGLDTVENVITGLTDQVGSFVILYPNSITSIEKLKYDLPGELHLYQNYPNPFNTCTIIELDVPQMMNILLELYNLKGQRIAVLTERKNLPAGSYQLSFDRGELSRGVYFYRLITNKGILIKKMIIQ